MKRLLIFLGIVAAVILIISLGYYFGYRRINFGTPAAPGETTSNLPLPTTPTSLPTTLPNVGSATTSAPKFGLVSSAPAIEYFLDGQNNIFLVQTDGQIVQISGGKPLVLSSAVINKVVAASFSADGKKVFVLFGDLPTPQLSVFDLPTKTWQPITDRAISAAWSPATSTLAYLAPTAQGVNLTTYNLTSPKAKPQTILALHASNVVLDWVSPKEMLLKERSSAYASGSAFLIDPTQKTITPVIQDRFGLDLIWDAVTNVGLAFISNDTHRGGRLRIIDTGGNSLQNLTLATLPEKCLFYSPEAVASTTITTSSSTSAATGTKAVVKAAPVKHYLLCALPRTNRDLTLNPLPDAYLQKLFFTADDFYRVDLEAGAIETVFTDPNISLDATNLRRFGQTLFFENRLDGLAYWLTLPG